MSLLRPLLVLSLVVSCTSYTSNNQHEFVAGFSRTDIYSPFKLTTDLKNLSSNQKKMLGILIEAAQVMDNLFWLQGFNGDKQQFLSGFSDKKLREFAEVNYGPWDRLDGDSVYLKGFSPKYPGAQFYPNDMTKAEFEKSKIKDKKGLYSIVERDQSGKLRTVPYNIKYKEGLTKAANLLRKAAKLASNKAFAKYLNMRADSFLNNSYRPSDMAWMDMKNNPIDIVIGPIESYEDQLFGYRTAFESYVLVKDMAWSKRLARYVKFLPELQKSLPVAAKYKREKPGTSADLNAYDVIYYAGLCNAGGKTIAINLPNDEVVQLKKGTRRLQLKNIMRAKFEKILMPIAKQVIHPSQLKYINFDAFFANTMFHEVAHGLGIKKTINGKGMVRAALKEHASPIEEGKADTLGLYMIEQLFKKKQMPKGKIENHYVTFMAGAFRAIRFGASSAHAKADMIRFNFFKEKGAFTRDKNGYYTINFEKMRLAIKDLSKLILTIQGNGDYKRLDKLLKTSGVIGSQLKQDLKKIEEAKIPVDITVVQGKPVLGL